MFILFMVVTLLLDPPPIANVVFISNAGGIIPKTPFPNLTIATLSVVYISSKCLLLL